jgi:hypothetical protein
MLVWLLFKDKREIRHLHDILVFDVKSRFCLDQKRFGLMGFIGDTVYSHNDNIWIS